MTTDAYEPPETDPDFVIGERIAFGMRRRKISQGQMAMWLGVDQSVLSKKLRGLRRWYFTEVATAAVRLDMHIAELVGGEAPEGWTKPYAIEARPERFELPTFCLVARERHLSIVRDAA